MKFPQKCVLQAQTLQRWPPAAISKRQNAHPVQPECRCPTNHKTLLTGIEGDLRKSGEPGAALNVCARVQTRRH
jgi:hypothetical protein